MCVCVCVCVCVLRMNNVPREPPTGYTIPTSLPMFNFLGWHIVPTGSNMIEVIE